MKLHCQFTSFFLTLLLAGCASSSVEEQRSVNADQGLAIAFNFSNHRRGELEPCGCSINPKGGIVREVTAHKVLGGDFPSVSSGITFLPREHAKLSPAVKQGKAKFIVEGLNALKTAVVAPAIDDGALGTAVFRAIAKDAKFDFTSANLVERASGKLLFKPFVEKTIAGQKVTFLGISDPATQERNLKTEWRALSPKKVLQDFFFGSPRKKYGSGCCAHQFRWPLGFTQWCAVKLLA